MLKAMVAVFLNVMMAGSVSAGISIFDNTTSGLAGFNAAASAPPIRISFDDIAVGANITGRTVSGITFLAAATNQSPLIVVRGDTTYTPSGFIGAPFLSTNKLYPTSGTNILSPGGNILSPGRNDLVENDDLEIIFTTPVSAFGFDHISQSADGFSFTRITVFNQFGTPIYAGAIPISNFGNGGPSRSDFWGAVTTGQDRIKHIIIDEFDDNNAFPDCNIGFDTFRYR
jgi:hypothetical protein